MKKKYITKISNQSIREDDEGKFNYKSNSFESNVQKENKITKYKILNRKLISNIIKCDPTLNYQMKLRNEEDIKKVKYIYTNKQNEKNQEIFTKRVIEGKYNF